MGEVASVRSQRVVRSLVGPGIRLHVLPTDLFATTVCRVVLHRDLGAEATATSLLSQVLQSATARLPTRRALADRLADLYGATLDVSVQKVGDRQLLLGTLEWPTDHVPRASRQLGDGLALLSDVLSDPVRGPGGLDPGIVETERKNLERSLRALPEDRYRYAEARAIALTCAGEPHALEVLGRLEDLAAITPGDLAALHARLLARAPADVFLAGDVDPREAREAVTRHLLWPNRRARPVRPPSASSVRTPRRRPRRVIERQDVVQGRIVLTWRGRVPPSSPLAPAARALAGLLGGGSFARLFRVVREEQGLCYYADASWSTAKGYLLVHTGIDAEDESRALRLIRRLQAEVARGEVDDAAWRAWRETEATRAHALREDRRAMLAWHQGRAALGLDPSPARWRAETLSVTTAGIRRVGRRLGPEVTFLLRPPGVGVRP